MAELETESVDSIVTDPPYGLTQSKKGGSGAASLNLEHPGGRARITTGGGFMGQKWDASVPGAEFWREALRVAKPGAHLLAFGGTRTFHRLACAIEDAGWEIRDCLGWLYGSGFPKSLDVSKAIDKAAGASPEVQARTLRAARERAGMRREEVAAAVGCTLSSVRDWEEGRARAKGRPVEFITPSAAYRDALADLLGYTADERQIVGARADRRDDGTIIGLGHSGVEYGDPATAAASQWQGWGTALKPAWEPVILARKPLAGTVAANVLAHGTGGLNIDGCRIGTEPLAAHGGGQNGNGRKYGGGNGIPAILAGANPHTGRWPANVLHDGSDEVTALFPQRFFYCAKASKTDRDEGCETLGERAGKRTLSGGADTRGRPTPVNCNPHPTVKPTALMRYLCRLVTPLGGVILDPFCGSGSTGKAAILEGFDFIGIDDDAEYIAIADARIAAVSRQEALALA